MGDFSWEPISLLLFHEIFVIALFRKRSWPARRNAPPKLVLLLGISRVSFLAFERLALCGEKG